MIGADHGNGTATVLNDDFIAGIYPTQAAAARTTGITTWDGQYSNPADQLPSTTTAGFIDTLNLSTTATLFSLSTTLITAAA